MENEIALDRLNNPTDEVIPGEEVLRRLAE